MAETIISKECKKCKTIKSLNEFFKDNSRKDGLSWACKQCEKTRNRQYRHTEKGKITNYKKCRNYQKTPRGRQGSAEYRKHNKNKIKAQHVVGYAIRIGVLVPPTSLRCSCCDKMATLYHHNSYKPECWLVVIPFCNVCHWNFHNKLSLSG